MGRLSTVDDANIYGAVGEHMARHGSIRLQDVVAATGVSVGSLYHRYGSREALLAQTWVDAVESFQSAFFEALDSGLPDSGERAAMTTPQFCRKEVARARVLVCCRREELLSPDLPAELTDQIEHINSDAKKKLLQFAKDVGVPIEACRLGLVAFPLGAVRSYLPHARVPKSIDGYVAAAYRAVIEESLGDGKS